MLLASKSHLKRASFGQLSAWAQRVEAHTRRRSGLCRAIGIVVVAVAVAGFVVAVGQVRRALVG